MIEMLNWEGDQLTWTNLKPRFQLQFVTQSNDKLINDRLSNLAMKPNESTDELLARITNTMVIIKECYATYENKVAVPANHNANGRYFEATATNDSVNNAMQFFKMQVFWAALPADILKVVTQYDQNTMALDDMYQITTTTQREAGAKLTKSVTAVDKDSHSDTADNDNEVATFQNPKSTRFASKNKKQFSAPTRSR
jgi:hypothetical protein